MSVKKIFTQTKVLIVCSLFLLFFIAVLFASFFRPSDHISDQQANIAMRAIGDKLLTAKYDFETPVPPIQQINAKTLRLNFKEAMAINPDQLADLALKHLHAEITPRAIVSVWDIASETLVYGFEINHAAQKEIPCLGRILPESDYYLEVSFFEKRSSMSSANASALGLISLSILCFFVIGNFIFKKKENTIAVNDVIEKRGIRLDLRAKEIIFKNYSIKLTDKEFQILHILFSNEGKLVPRENLVQEVWLKNGVVTSRSLDMYISRLRKKIKPLPNAQIINQRGDGYILKI